MNKKFFTKKRVVWTIVIIAALGVGFLIYRSRKNAVGSGVQTTVVRRQDLKETVLATGQVISNVDLGLSFEGSGVVRQIFVKEGGVVKSGQVLALLDLAFAKAVMTSALGVLAQAQANYEKIILGASSEQINVDEKAVAVAQTTLDNAIKNLDNTKQQQNTLVKNAYNTMLNSTIALIPGPNNSSSVNPSVSGTYIGISEGRYTISLFSGGNTQYSVSGLGSSTGSVPTNPGATVPIGNGLYLQFPTGTYHQGDIWTIDIPNMQASTYLTNYNAYQSALQTQQSAITVAESQISSARASLAQAQASLDQERAAARPVDIDAAKAQILSAEGSVASARATLGNLTLRAPADGTVTQIDIKVGEQAIAAQTVMVLQSVDTLHAEANVSEANIAALKVGQAVDYTFDALGPDRHFKGTIQIINPASTVISGVVNYKVTTSLTGFPDLKPGMTVNMTALVAEKDKTLAVPNSAIINQNGAQSVRVIDDMKNKTYHLVPVQIGMSADGGLVEIISGLNEGEIIVTYIKP